MNKSFSSTCIVLFFIMICSSFFPLASAYDFGKGGPQFHYANPLRTLNPQSNTQPNYSFTIILPNNTSAHITGILSNSNYTALKNNIATMAVINIVPTNSPANLNYCPVALAILNGQDGYLNLVYNTTRNLDLTPMIYPDYCFVETGPNPIDGNGIIPVPEFPTSLLVLMIIPMILVVMIPYWKYHK